MKQRHLLFLLFLAASLPVLINAQSDSPTIINTSEYFEWQDQRFLLSPEGVQSFLSAVREEDKTLANQLQFDWNKMVKKNQQAETLFYAGNILGATMMLSPLFSGGQNTTMVYFGGVVSIISTWAALPKLTKKQNLLNLLNKFNRYSTSSKVNFVLTPFIRANGMIGLSLQF